MNEQEMRQRFQDLLPWHVNGTLDPAQRAWVEDYVRARPDAKAELAWTEALQTKTQERVPDVAADAGWSKLQQRIRLERCAEAPSFAERIGRFLSRLRLTPAMATAAAVILVQAGVIGTLLQQTDLVEPSNKDVYRNIGSGPYTGPVVEVTFREAATEKEMRRLLMSVKGNIVSGPSQLGNYLVLISNGKVNDATKSLQASPLVDSVSVLEHMPHKAD